MISFSKYLAISSMLALLPSCIPEFCQLPINSRWAGGLDIDQQYMKFDKIDVLTIVKKTLAVHPKDSLSVEEIENIAKEFNLFAKSATAKINFTRADIEYFFIKQLNEEDLRIEFGAREIILDAAIKHSTRIKDIGTLSWAAEQIFKKLRVERECLFEKMQG